MTHPQRRRRQTRPLIGSRERAGLAGTGLADGAGLVHHVVPEVEPRDYHVCRRTSIGLRTRLWKTPRRDATGVSGFHGNGVWATEGGVTRVLHQLGTRLCGKTTGQLQKHTKNESETETETTLHSMTSSKAGITKKNPRFSAKIRRPEIETLGTPSRSRSVPLPWKPDAPRARISHPPPIRVPHPCRPLFLYHRISTRKDLLSKVLKYKEYFFV